MVILAALAIGIVYFLPLSAKEKALTTFAGVVPEELKNKAVSALEELVLTPPEKRAKILEKLAQDVAAAKDALADGSVSQNETQQLSQIISETEKAIEELKTKNDDSSLPSLVTQKIVEQLLSPKTASTTQTCEK